MSNASTALPPHSHHGGSVMPTAQLERNRHAGLISQFTTFLGVGATGLVVDLTCFSALLWVSSPIVARPIAIWVGMTWNYQWNEKMTFRRGQGRLSMTRYAKFCGGCSVGAGVNWGTTLLLLAAVPICRDHNLVAAFSGSVVAAFFNFTLCRSFVFANRPSLEDAQVEKP